MDLLLQHLKMNAVSFSKSIGKERPQLVYDILKGKTKNISHTLANQIISVFPEIRKPWLIAGDGPMLESVISENPQSNEAPQPQPQQPNDDSAATPALDELAELRRSLLQLIENNGKLIESNAMLVDSNRQLVQNQQTQFERLIRLVDK
ncbi:MAG: hypothetical protein J6U57_04065 [Bacteroidales bacterium]|nr:hypothetical protein [Bacteroidales bacterium]